MPGARTDDECLILPGHLVQDMVPLVGRFHLPFMLNLIILEKCFVDFTGLSICFIPDLDLGVPVTSSAMDISNAASE